MSAGPSAVELREMMPPAQYKQLCATPVPTDRYDTGSINFGGLQGFVPLGRVASIEQGESAIEATQHLPTLPPRAAIERGAHHLMHTGRIADVFPDGQPAGTAVLSFFDSRFMPGSLAIQADTARADHQRLFPPLASAEHIIALYVEDHKADSPVEDVDPAKRVINGDLRLAEIISSSDAYPGTGLAMRHVPRHDGDDVIRDMITKDPKLDVQDYLITEIKSVTSDELRKQLKSDQAVRACVDAMITGFGMQMTRDDGYDYRNDRLISGKGTALADQAAKEGIGTYFRRALAIDPFMLRVPFRAFVQMKELSDWETRTLEYQRRLTPEQELSVAKRRTAIRAEFLQALDILYFTERLVREDAGLPTVLAGLNLQTNVLRWQVEGLDEIDYYFANHVMPNIAQKFPGISARDADACMNAAAGYIQQNATGNGPNFIVGPTPGNQLMLGHLHAGGNGANEVAYRSYEDEPALAAMGAYPNEIRRSFYIGGVALANGVIRAWSHRSAGAGEASPRQWVAVDLTRAPACLLDHPAVRQRLEAGPKSGSDSLYRQGIYLSDQLAFPYKPSVVAATYDVQGRPYLIGAAQDAALEGCLVTAADGGHPEVRAAVAGVTTRYEHEKERGVKPEDRTEMSLWKGSYVVRSSGLDPERTVSLGRAAVIDDKFHVERRANVVIMPGLREPHKMLD